MKHTIFTNEVQFLYDVTGWMNCLFLAVIVLITLKLVLDAHKSKKGLVDTGNNGLLMICNILMLLAMYMTFSIYITLGDITSDVSGFMSGLVFYILLGIAILLMIVSAIAFYYKKYKSKEVTKLVDIVVTIALFILTFSIARNFIAILLLAFT